MATAAPRLFVDTPPITPSRFGLLSVAEMPQTPQPQWINGVEYHPNPQPEGFIDSMECLGGPAESKDLPEGLPWDEVDPIRIYEGFTCKSVGLTADEVNDYARKKLAVSEGPKLEAELWTHTTGLLSDTTDVIAEEPVSLVAAVGLLESWLYTEYAGTGVIHLPRLLGTHADSKSIAHVTGPRLTTLLGTSLSFGNYPLAGPDGEPTEGVAWLVATGQVQVRRSEVRVSTSNGSSAFEPKTNTLMGLAERIYVVSWDQVSAAVPVIIPTS